MKKNLSFFYHNLFRRYVLIRKPMAYTPSHRFIFCVSCITISVILAVVFAVAPFSVAENNTATYIQPSNSPFCLFIPRNQAGQNLLLVDTIFSYVIIWFILGYTIVGELYSKIKYTVQYFFFSNYLFSTAITWS